MASNASLGPPSIPIHGRSRDLDAFGINTKKYRLTGKTILAPLVYLHPKEPYFPSDIGAQVKNTTPKQELNALPAGVPSELTLSNLDQLNNFGSNGTNIYLTSNEDVSKTPPFLKGVQPNADGKTEGVISCAVIVADKGNDIVDAFYMYFYAYNYGGVLQPFNQELGDHVGDWEHTMVRFKNGVPQAVWASAHSGGQAFNYSILTKDKSGLRPIVFSANGTHAVYATSSIHSREIPGEPMPVQSFLNDYTDTGSIWDPIQSAYWYSWTASTPAANGTTATPSPTDNTSKVGTFTAYDSATPVGWLYFAGRWGDFQYPDSDPRQVNFLGLGVAHKYESGPTGPADKNLGRTEVWPSSDGRLIQKLEPGM